MESIFFYIMTNPDWSGKYKYGVTVNLTQRIYSSFEQHSKRNSYVKIFEIGIPEEYRYYKLVDKLYILLVSFPCDTSEQKGKITISFSSQI